MAFVEGGVTVTNYFAKITDWSGFADLGGAQVTGNNSFRQLATGDNTYRSSPITISSPYNWNEVAILRSGQGSVLINQDNRFYSVGNINLRYSPSTIKTTNVWIQVSASGPLSGASAAIQSNGSLWMWGNNSWGQLGLNDLTVRNAPTQVGTEFNWNSVDAGKGTTTFAIQSNGYLWAWGNNSYGQLGNFNISGRSTPAIVGFPAVKWLMMATGFGHSIGIRSDGTLWAMGSNNFGQLGIDNGGAPILSPILVDQNQWQKISAGKYCSAGIRNNGTLWTWGSNSFGQLGTSDSTGRSTPVQIGTDLWKDIAVGESHTVAIRSDNTLWAWGQNNFGQLGLSVSGGAIRYSPVQVGDQSNWTTINSNENHVLALKSNGTLWAWGYNLYGQIGNNTNANQLSPIQIGSSLWKKISAGGYHSLGIQSDGTLWAWGQNGFYGQLGNNTIGPDKSTPIQIGTNLWTDIVALDQTSAAIMSDGTLWTWGSNDYGQLGDIMTRRPSPVQVGTENDWSSLHGGGWYHFFGILVDNKLYGIGRNDGGNLGLFDTVNKYSPVLVGYGAYDSWAQASAGQDYVVAIQSNGTLWAWGNNSFGQLGTSNQTTISTYVQVGTSLWSQISCGLQHSLAIQSNGTLWGWGYNGFGQLGTSDITNRSSPVQVGSDLWGKISSGFYYSMAIKSDGTLWGWGLNDYGQLGISNLTNRSSPIQIGSLLWKEIACGYRHTMAIQSNGTLWAWGNNSTGQLATGDLTRRLSPVQISTKSNWIKISTGYETSAAIDNDNFLWTWGSSTYGALGVTQHISTTSIPVKVSDLQLEQIKSSQYNVYALDKFTKTMVQTSDDDIPLVDPTNSISWKKFGTGAYHFTGIKSDGTAWSVGNNSYGQLGLSDITYRRSLTQIGTGTNWNDVYCADYGTLLVDTSLNGWVFGKNDLGQLGLSDTTNRSSPVQISGIQVSSASTDDQNTWIVDPSGQLWQTGLSNTYYWGTSNRGKMSSPLQVGLLANNWYTISLGYYHALAIRSDGTLWTWGYNLYGQLGTSNITNRSIPIQIGSDSTWSKVIAGYNHSTAILSDGTLWVWGRNNTGQLGTNDANDKLSPVQIAGLWKEIAAGGNHTLGIQSDGTLWTWGQNNFGQLGSSNTTNRSSPVQIGSSLWLKVGCGKDFSVAINSDGTLWTCGYNQYYSLGLTDTTHRYSFVQIGSSNLWKEVSSGGYVHTLGIQSDGTLWAWGWGAEGQTGTGGNAVAPIKIGSSLWKKISCGYRHSLAINSDGTLWTWGANSYGQVGNNSLATAVTTVGQRGSDVWNMAVGGGFTSFAIQSNSTLWSWGNNSYGQLIDTFSITWFQKKSIATDVYQYVVSDRDNTFFIKANGSLWAVGNNSFGVLGQSNTTSRSSPVQIGTINTVYKIDTKSYSSMFILK